MTAPPRSPFAHLAVMRSRTPPIETPAEAAARRRTEYDALVNPSAEQIAEAAAWIVLAGRKAKGEVEFFDAPPQPVRRMMTAPEIVAAAKKARGEA
jgi:hypothetical protein